MATLNKVMIIGNLCRDPESRMAGSTKVATFTVAVTEKFKTKNGDPIEKTEFVNVVFWGSQAEVCEKYLKKGSSVYVEGKMETQSWEDSSGQKKSRTEVRGLTMQMLGQRQNSTSGSEERSSGEYRNDNPTYSKAPEVIEDDLPF